MVDPRRRVVGADPARGGPLLLGLFVTFVPSFAVSPGLVQKTYGARSADTARAAVLWNALALAAFAFVPALLGMAARATRPPG